uniref:Late endosomal/lysosomal adaptor and MAPK and MTOR activator 5 n=1 Tax=Culicoides sonorensis TaxID=179676 RepID=A0A336KGR7_CULSO
MENQILENVSKISANQNVTGVILANSHGLCIAASGKASADSAGIVNEIVNQAQKLHPDAKGPVVLLDYGDKQCMIQKNNDVVGAVYKLKK